MWMNVKGGKGKGLNANVDDPQRPSAVGIVKGSLKRG
jgi:hypothetical protein